MSNLSERLRPRNLSEFVGQRHLFEERGLLTLLLKRREPVSLIFWGPPGTGKTTLAQILAKEFKTHFISLSAVDTSIKELKDLLNEAERLKRLGRATIVFIDEIHRFNKAQQSFLLPYLDRGEIYLFGATTENPSFEIISPLLSRVKIVRLYPLSEEDLFLLLKRALSDPDRGYGRRDIEVEEELLWIIGKSAQGDARQALNTLELLIESAISTGKTRICPEDLPETLLKTPLIYDKSGEEHYNLISAYHKSLRGSDPDASIYWLVRMLRAGEDPLYIARRLLICAVEDVGLADPQALIIALSAYQAFEILGPPEGELALAMATIYVALAPKSNSAYRALKEADEEINKTGSKAVPLHLRNPVTHLMQHLGYGKNYKYPHDFEGAFVEENYLPEELEKKRFYRPTRYGEEAKLYERYLKLWGKFKGLDVEDQ